MTAVGVPGDVPDVVDRLLGIAPGSRLDRARRGREIARDNMQASFMALFAPASFGDVPAVERFAIAAFVTGLHREAAMTGMYADRIAVSDGLAPVVREAAGRGAVEGPYGRFPPGRLTSEDVPGPEFRVDDGARAVLGDRLAAALEHAHMLVFHPRDASAARLQKLFDAGWSTTDIVTISQIVAFLSFQVRVVIGLRALQASFAEGN